MKTVFNRRPYQVVIACNGRTFYEASYNAMDEALEGLCDVLPRLAEKYGLRPLHVEILENENAITNSY